LGVDLCFELPAPLLQAGKPDFICLWHSARLGEHSIISPSTPISDATIRHGMPLLWTFK
jgi:hypothetical protein